MTPPVEIASFVVRVVVEAPPDASGAVRWHGLVRHVQSDAECHFTRWAEAQSFMEDHAGLVSRDPEDLPTNGSQISQIDADKPIK